MSATRSPAGVAVLAGLLALTAVAPAAAEPLPAAECEQLTTERAGLIASGIAQRMSKGAAWAKANLPAGDLKAIERYITLDELLNFRCGHAKVGSKLPMAEEDAADAATGAAVTAAAAAKAAEAAKGAATAPAAGAVPTGETPAPAAKKARPKKQAGEGEKKQAGEGETAKKAKATDGDPAAPKPKPRAKAKAKADDAYKAPAPAPAPAAPAAVPGSG